jgi:orotate phosphoribosyltransferase-like protein
MNSNLDNLFQTATPGDVSDIMKWLLDNRVIRLTHFTTKFGGPIPFDFRIDRAGSGSAVNKIGERMADRVIEIEKDLNLKFDSMLCSLFSGVFSGIGTAMWLEKKYNRNIKIAISRRSYNQQLGADAWSVHPLKEKSFVGELGDNILIHDEMTNTGATVNELIEICNSKNKKPQAVMIIADRILDPLPQGTRIRMFDQTPCYSLITHYEIVDWCNTNPEIWQALYEKTIW